MKATHTPGPWRQTGINVRAGDALICYAMNHHANAETPEPEKLANARLISCAPDLLAALNRLIQSLPEDSNEYPDSASARQVFDSIRFAREAISKATGGTL